MTFFYLTAVKGDLHVHTIETIIVRRLEYLQALLNGDQSVYNEYVVEGSVYDNVGHFMLSVITILGGNREFSRFILKAEVELFKKRLALLTAYDVRTFAKKLLRNIKKHEHIPYHINPLQTLCQHLVLKDLAQHICCSHKNECCNYKIKLNFKHCLNFISKREVELQNGTAFIPCGRWKQYLTDLFSNNIMVRLQKTDLVALKSDPRVMEILQKIKLRFFPLPPNSSSILLSEEVDNISKLFPPCMLNLHLSLRKKHRLSHYQRFYYSLFLKDIGMPVEEAVYFWKSEYRQSPNGSHSCCHNWEKDEKKYLYGIRHMYGMEGGRRNYTSVNCQRIQSVENACTEGGCPFKSFDNLKMRPLLNHCTEELAAQINNLKNSNQYSKSCMLYLRSFVKTEDCDILNYNFTPVKYYEITSKKFTGNL